MEDEGGGGDHLAADGVEGAGAEVSHGDDAFLLQELAAQLLEAGEEHPGLHGDHGREGMGQGQLEAAFDEHGEQVGLAVRVVLVGKFLQLGVHALGAHVGWVGDDDVVSGCKVVRHFQQSHDLLMGVLQKDVACQVLGIDGGTDIAGIL